MKEINKQILTCPKCGAFFRKMHQLSKSRRAVKTIVPQKETLADKYMEYFVPFTPQFPVKNADVFGEMEYSLKDFEITTTYGIGFFGNVVENV